MWRESRYQGYSYNEAQITRMGREPIASLIEKEIQEGETGYI
jgi:hypothetical protein